MYDYVTRYKPEYIWSDGAWLAPPEYWTSQQLLAWLYNDRCVNWLRDIPINSHMYEMGSGGAKHYFFGDQFDSMYSMYSSIFMQENMGNFTWSWPNSQEISCFVPV